MRGDSYFFGMRGLGHYGCIPEDGGQFLLYSINGDSSLKRCFAEEDFHEIIDFNDLPNSLFACNVHQSVFEDEDSKIILVQYSILSENTYDLLCSAFDILSDSWSDDPYFFRLIIEVLSATEKSC
ncbi:hypothetical protein WISP_72377 [Willisornis vidua]|uniref:Uncharacterized protein n=1 Tax=Willisornis vidua TaxID=1566151 RepID=A0ABQ9DD86_9PASS|nr:hypothetical protein WISP_72377 [Willisornis vidua]